MSEITVTHYPEGHYTIIGNPNDDKFWKVLKSSELVNTDFSNDDDQIQDWIDELRSELRDKWNSNSLTLTLIGIDIHDNEIIELSRKYRSRGHVIGVWNWTHSYYVLSLPEEDLRIPMVKAGKDGFGRFGNHVVGDF